MNVPVFYSVIPKWFDYWGNKYLAKQTIWPKYRTRQQTVGPSRLASSLSRSPAIKTVRISRSNDYKVDALAVIVNI